MKHTQGFQAQSALKVTLPGTLLIITHPAMNIDILDWPGSQGDTQKIPLHQLPSSPPAISSRYSETTTETFGKLIQLTHDGEQGFLYAAQHVYDRGLRDELHKFARERRSITAELIHFLDEEGCEAPLLHSSTRASLHRTWMHVRTLLTDHDDQSILDEVERGEAEAVQAFQGALTQTPALTHPAHVLTGSVYQKIQRAHTRIRSLRDSGIYQHTP